MKIIVCIKQVPDTEDIKWTINNTIDRDGVESIVNPYDIFATDTAIYIKEQAETINQSKTEVIALTMGPSQAKEALKDALAQGADNAVLLCDKAFSGSDTSATARIISQCINKKINDFDLIVCGQYATDGETGQTGPSIAQNLEIDLITNVINITDVKQDYIIAERESEYGYETVKIMFPALICVSKTSRETEPPKIINRIKAQNTEIQEYNAKDIEIQKENTGVRGSFTYIKNVCQLNVDRNPKIIENTEEKEIAEILINKILEVQDNGKN